MFGTQVLKTSYPALPAEWPDTRTLEKEIDMSAVTMGTVGFGAAARPVRVMSVRAMSVRVASARPRLRLTKRGRGVHTPRAAAPQAIAAIVVALNGGGATATLEGSGVPFEYVTVDSGESLWQLAETIAPNADPRDVIEQLVQLNRLESSEVFPGQQLAIPAQYAH
jgi:hypothetical protein